MKRKMTSSCFSCVHDLCGVIYDEIFFCSPVGELEDTPAAAAVEDATAAAADSEGAGTAGTSLGAGLGFSLFLLPLGRPRFFFCGTGMVSAVRISEKRIELAACMRAEIGIGVEG